MTESHKKALQILKGISSGKSIHDLIRAEMLDAKIALDALYVQSGSEDVELTEYLLY